MKRPGIFVFATLFLAVSLAGCSSPGADVGTKTSDTKETTLGAQGDQETAGGGAQGAADAKSSDLTDAVKSQSEHADLIVKATLTEGENLTVETTLVDPEAQASDEAEIAVAICEAAQRALASTVVIYVTEQNGQNFAIGNHQVLGEKCVEF